MPSELAWSIDNRFKKNYALADTRCSMADIWQRKAGRHESQVRLFLPAIPSPDHLNYVLTFYRFFLNYIQSQRLRDIFYSFISALSDSAWLMKNMDCARNEPSLILGISARRTHSPTAKPFHNNVTVSASSSQRPRLQQGRPASNLSGRGLAPRWHPVVIVNEVVSRCGCNGLARRMTCSICIKTPLR